MSKRRIKRLKDTYLIPLILVISSFLIVSFTKSSFFSFLILTTGLLNGWYAGLGKWYNYAYGAVFAIINSYVSWQSHLYGIACLSALLYFPLQIQGMVDWHTRKNKNSEVKVRGFNTKTSILITICCFAGSVALGSILTKIPGQELAFLDATSNAINICAIILMNLRFRECWWVLLGNNVADLAIWIINFSNQTPNSLMMLIVSIGYLGLNIIGLLKWEKIKNKRRH
ncbi:MAG: nicotinamide riboside transporter PnuC [Bacilli bacterium]|nr:nicotinamide riboside transporter PnuC [Bacilli bacterium]